MGHDDVHCHCAVVAEVRVYMPVSDVDVSYYDTQTSFEVARTLRTLDRLPKNVSKRSFSSCSLSVGIVGGAGGGEGTTRVGRDGRGFNSPIPCTPPIYTLASPCSRVALLLAFPSPRDRRELKLASWPDNDTKP